MKGKGEMKLTRKTLHEIAKRAVEDMSKEVDRNMVGEQIVSGIYSDWAYDGCYFKFSYVYRCVSQGYGKDIIPLGVDIYRIQSELSDGDGNCTEASEQTWLTIEEEIRRALGLPAADEEKTTIFNALGAG